MIGTTKVPTLLAKIWPLAFVLCTLLLVRCGAAPHGRGDYFVKPSFRSACPYLQMRRMNSSEQRCMTLNEYAANTSQFSQHREVRMVFLGGVHYLTRQLNLSRVENVRMISSNTMREFYDDTEVRIEVSGKSDMIFDSVGSVAMENLVISGANLILDNTPKRQAELRNVRLLKSSVYHRLRSEVREPEQEPNEQHDEEAEREQSAEKSEGEPVEESDGDPVEEEEEGGQVEEEDGDQVEEEEEGDKVDGDSDELQNSNTTAPMHTGILIENSFLEDSSGTGLLIVDQRIRGDLRVNIQNSSISHHLQGGILIESTARLHFEIANSTVKGNSIGRSRNVFSSAAALGIYSGRPDGARVTIRETVFANNKDLRGMSMVVRVSRAQTVEVEDSKFEDNHGTAIRAANIKDSLRLRGNVTFRNNVARNGGALTLLSTMVDFMPDSNVVFEGNHVDNVGGAIFVETSSTMYEENNPTTLVPCFYRFPEMHHEDRVRNVTFGNNSAVEGGHGIYGASLRSFCVVDKSRPGDEYPIRSGDQLVRDGFLFNETTNEHISSLVSSQPTRVCVLDQQDEEKSVSESCSDASQIFISISAYPGEVFSFKVVLVGAEFGTGVGEVHAEFLPVHNNSPRLLSKYQQSQSVTELNSPKTISYSVHSRNSYEVLMLTTGANTEVSYGNEEQLLEDIEIYNSSEIIPVGLLTTPIYVNVSLTKCPAGFFLDTDSMACKCNPRVCNEANGGREDGNRGLLYFGKNLWVSGYYNGRVSGVMMDYCPFDYCKTSSSGINVSDPDTQCAMDHAGVLCGRCEDGYSLALGTDRCLRCSNDNIALILFFGLAGVLLVFFIHILNLTVTQGTLGGLLFYVNILWAYRSIFFAHHEGWFLKIFIAWMNLDFGIESCFSKGLTAYSKTWMQFVFPLYVWGIAGCIALLSYGSKKLAERYESNVPAQVLVKITNFFGNNSAQVFATLFILTYAKLLRNAIIIMVPANLYVYTDSGERIDSLTKVVWSFDGNLTYAHFPHIFLLFVALLLLTCLLIPYTALLLFAQPIQKLASRFKSLNRLMPFIDAYTRPLNLPNHSWVGLLLLARFVLITTFIITYARNPASSLVALVITVVLLLAVLTYTGQLYNDPKCVNIPFLPKVISFRSINEVSFLLNLVIIGVSVLSVDYITVDVHMKSSVLYASVIVAFFQFIGILSFHVWCVLRNRVCGSSADSKEEGGYQSLGYSGTLPALPTPIVDTKTEESFKVDRSLTTSTTLLGSTKSGNGNPTYKTSVMGKSAAISSNSTEGLPPSYNSAEALKSKLVVSSTDQQSIFSTSESDLRKPMLTESTSDKESNSSYSSFELRKPLLTDN